MSRLKTAVDQWKFNWKSVPRGKEGVVEVEVAAQASGEQAFVGEVRWKKDSDGIWLQLPHGVFGFDFKGQLDDNGSPVYAITQRHSNLEWENVAGSLGSAGGVAGGRAQKAKTVRVRAQMPGKIIRVLVKPDQSVQKDQPLVVMEAMKMENEIRASQTGKITQVHVQEGQAVESGADLLMIDCSSSGEN